MATPLTGGSDDREALDERLRARDAALAAMAARLDAAEQERDALARRAERQTDEIASLTARLLGDEPDRAELHARLQILQAELDALRTGPARWLRAPSALLARGRRWLARNTGSRP